MEEHTPVKYQEMRQMGETAKIIPSMFQVNTHNCNVYTDTSIAQVEKTSQVYEMNNLTVLSL